MDADQAHKVLGSALFLDVREPFEFEAGHIQDSQHIPIGQITARVSEVPADRPIVVVCQIGQRSGLVADFLSGQGLAAENLEGGLTAWVAAGYELITAAERGRIVDGYARDLTGERLNPD